MPLISVPWTSQPQEAVGIDWANPLARNIEFAVVPSLGLRNLVDGFSGFVGSGALDQVIPGVVGMTPAQTAYGTMVQPTLTSAGHPSAARSDVSVLSALVIGHQSANQNGDYRLGRGNGSASPAWSVGYHSGSDNGPHVAIGTFTRAGFGGGWTRIDRPTAVLLTADGSTARVYVGGAQVDSGSYTGPTYDYSSYAGRGVFFGGAANGAAAGPSFLGLMWANRVLTPDEVREISVNPWQLFTPRQIWVPQSAGGGNVTVNLSGISASFAQTAPAVSSTVSLVGENAAASAGALLPAFSFSLLGQAGAASAGTLSPSTSRGLSGQSAAFAAGAVIPSVAIAAIGLQATFASGTLTASSSSGTTVNLVGELVAFAQTAPSVNVTIALTGIAATMASGLLSASSGTAIITVKAGSWLRYKKLQ